MYIWGSGSNDVTGLDQTVSSCDVIVDGKSCVVPACVDGANCNAVLSIDDVTDGGGLVGWIAGARRDSTGSVDSGDEYV